MSSEIKFHAIAAMSDESRGIGFNNSLPWSVPEDAEYFLRVVKTTFDKSKINAVIVGTRTWESIPKEDRPISPCLNIIVSSRASFESLEISPNADLTKIQICRSLDEAVKLVKEKYSDSVEAIYAIGGTQIYKDSIFSEYFDRFYLTRIFGHFKCDTFLQPENFLSYFKKIDSEQLEKEEKLFQVKYNSIQIEPKSGNHYVFEVYEKIKN
ncbi:unnamed protein product [Brachionus calyciflorus]|uniref:dihydrofolate reductase n=1 Tax=Brachionus calyciflorus TaxID=104777 RepID=A0A813PNW3_9BILA|nr:unnamed protein product [Brachionus calyciflorus]